MNFTMVMIICFSVEVCTAMFDDSRYNSYDSCYEFSKSAVSYMQEMYPDSAGEVHCLTPKELAVYKKYIDEGGKPVLTKENTPLPEA